MKKVKFFVFSCFRQKNEEKNSQKGYSLMSSFDFTENVFYSNQNKRNPANQSNTINLVTRSTPTVVKTNDIESANDHEYSYIH